MDDQRDGQVSGESGNECEDSGEVAEFPRLSPSIAHKITTESPLSAWAAHRLLGNFKPEPTPTQIEGKLWHAAILGDHSEVEIVDADNFKTLAAQHERDEILDRGHIPIVKPKYDEMMPAAERIRERLRDDFGIEFNGQVEKRIEWDEWTDSGSRVACSSVLDHTNGAMIHDLKTGKAPTSIFRAAGLIAKSHAMLQDPAYRSALADATGIELERIEMMFIFVQTREPFSITPVTLAGDFRQLAEMRWRRALHQWDQCLSEGTEREHWPDITSAVTPVSCPTWMISQEIELEVFNE